MLFRSNGPISDLSELLLIKGITPQLYYGNENTPGLVNLLTVHGMAIGAGTSYSWPGRININTADVPVLTALLGDENEELAQAVYDFRKEMAAEKVVHDFLSLKWYKNITGLSDVTIDSRLITTSSDVFRIQSTASLNDIQTAVIAVVQRVQNSESGKWTCQVLNWKTE